MKRMYIMSKQNFGILDELLDKRRLLVNAREQYKLHCRMGNIKESLAVKIDKELIYNAKYESITAKINALTGEAN